MFYANTHIHTPTQEACMLTCIYKYTNRHTHTYIERLLQLDGKVMVDHPNK